MSEILLINLRFPVWLRRTGSIRSMYYCTVGGILFCRNSDAVCTTHTVTHKTIQILSETTVSERVWMVLCVTVLCLG